MALREEFEKTGNWLFKWRSYLPVFFFGLALLSLRHFRPLQNNIAEVLWELFCLSVSSLGLAVRILTVGFTPHRTSGRNTQHGQVANSLNVTGIYSVTRHPLYLGNSLMWFGISLFPMNESCSQRRNIYEKNSVRRIPDGLIKLLHLSLASRIMSNPICHFRSKRFCVKSMMAFSLWFFVFLLWIWRETICRVLLFSLIPCGFSSWRLAWSSGSYCEHLNIARHFSRRW